MSQLYFCYGSLKKGFHNHRVLGNSKYLGKTSIEGFVMYDTGFSYPAITKGNGIVHGEVYEVDSKLIEKSLDLLEGFNEFSTNNLYNKIKVNGMWVYVYACDTNGMEVVKDGYWRG